MFAECRTLLDEGLPPEPRTVFDERRPYLPLAVDRAGEGGAVAILHRDSSMRMPGPLTMVHMFMRRAGEWEFRGGGGGRQVPYPLTDRPPAAGPGDYLCCHGSGSTLMNPEHRLPWTGWYLHHSDLQASAEVRRVRARGRLLDVPFHGFLIVVWSGRRAPTIEALGKDGEVLTTLDLSLRVPA